MLPHFKIIEIFSSMICLFIEQIFIEFLPYIYKATCQMKQSREQLSQISILGLTAAVSQGQGPDTAAADSEPQANQFPFLISA